MAHSKSTPTDDDDPMEKAFSEYARNLEQKYPAEKQAGHSEAVGHPSKEVNPAGEALRAQLREVELATRKVIAALNKMHLDIDLSEVTSKARDLISSKVTPHLGLLSAAIPKGRFSQHQHLFASTMERLSFCVLLNHCLERITHLDVEALLTKDETQAALGIKPESNEDFHLDLEDYLGGVALLAEELAQFTVTSKSRFSLTPKRIAAFLRRVLGGFRLLGLKTDRLRLMFDLIKHSTEKAELIAYK